MEWFFALVPSLRGRLYAIGVVMAVMMSVLVVFVLSQMSGQTEAMRTVYEDRVVPLKQLKVVADAYAVNIVDATHKVRNGSFTWEQGAKSVEEAKGLIDKEWRAYRATQLVPEERKLADELAQRMAAADQAAAELKTLLAAKDEVGLASFAKERLYQAIDPVSDTVGALVSLQLEVALIEYQKAVAAERRAMLFSWGGLGVALVLGLGLAWLIARRVLRSLGAEPRELREMIIAIGEGDLTHRMDKKGGDDTSIAAYAERMQDSLTRLVGEIRDNAQALRTASEEISSGNLDLSRRTEETAGSMAQASSGLNEVLQRVRLRAGSFGEARQRVAVTSQVAGEAGQQMGEVITTMRGISESSRRIGDITGTIDGIAFQTNILALNAAVEAARAGEAGRGFAVVAGEVRLLARRSAEAAREIKSLIGASVERSEAGARQVDGTGSTLTNMVGDVEKLAQLVAEIAAAAEQDDADMGAVLNQMSRVDQAVQQNAALVEQIAASSQSLLDQSQRLAQAVGGFRT